MTPNRTLFDRLGLPNIPGILTASLILIGS